MSVTARPKLTASSESVRAVSVSSTTTPTIFLTRPNSEREPGEGKVLPASSCSLSSKEQQVLDDLAMLFTVQEERCYSRASRDFKPSRPGREDTNLSTTSREDTNLSRISRENTQLSRASFTSSQLAAEAAFIYQHIDFEVLSKCMPGFVKNHLNKNGRYLPETFILRVNYWRRRRAIGDDSTVKRTSKEKSARTATEQTKPASGPRAPSVAGKSPRPQSVSSKQTSSSESRVTMISG